MDSNTHSTSKFVDMRDSAETTAEEPSAIDKGIYSVDNEIDRLEAVLGQLQYKLKPVLADSEPRMDDDSTYAAPGTSEVTRRLMGFSTRLSRISSEIQELNQRVEV